MNISYTAASSGLSMAAGLPNGPARRQETGGNAHAPSELQVLESSTRMARPLQVHLPGQSLLFV